MRITWQNRIKVSEKNLLRGACGGLFPNRHDRWSKMRGPTTSDLRATEWGSLTTAYIQKYGRATLNVCDALCGVHGLATIDR
jgi:hypothetical protein